MTASGKGGPRGPRGRGRDAGAPANAGRPADGDEDGRRQWPVIAAVIAIPVVVFAAFLSFGPLRDTVSRPAPPAGAPAGTAAAPGAGPGAGAGDRAHMGDEEIAQMAQRLASRLEREPGDAAGWRTLARTYYVLKRFGDAVAAYEKLARLAPIDDADVLADYADALAMSHGQRLEGRPMELVRKALERNPDQWKALSMAATEAFQRGDYGTAARHWERALKSLPPDSDMARAIQGSLAQARQGADGRGPQPPGTK